MTTFTAKVIFEDSDHDQAVVAVQTTRCWYRVAIVGSEVTVVGPGVEERTNLAEVSEDFSFFDSMTYKGKALFAVILLEERE